MFIRGNPLFLRISAVFPNFTLMRDVSRIAEKMRQKALGNGSVFSPDIDRHDGNACFSRLSQGPPPKPFRGFQKDNDSRGNLLDEAIGDEWDIPGDMTDQIIDEPCLKPPDRIRTPGRQDESKLGSLLCQEMEERCGRFELRYCLTVHPDGAVQARHG